MVLEYDLPLRQLCYDKCGGCNCLQLPCRQPIVIGYQVRCTVGVSFENHVVNAAGSDGKIVEITLSDGRKCTVILCED